MDIIACIDCGELFDDQQSLVLHREECHPVYKPYQCTVCSKRFKISQYLKDHMRVHTGERPFACDICEKAFKSKSHLRRHIAARHLSQATNEACPVCGKRFRTKTSLRQHMVVHTGERLFRCTVCEKAFALSSTLATHRRVHMSDDERYRFRCEHCGKLYAKLVNLKTHMRKCADVAGHGPEYQRRNLAKYNEHMATHSTENVPGPYQIQQNHRLNLRRSLSPTSQKPQNSRESPPRKNSPSVMSPKKPVRDVSDDDDVSTDTEFSSNKTDVIESKGAKAWQRSVSSPVVIVLSSSDEDDVIIIKSEQNPTTHVNLGNEVTLDRRGNERIDKNKKQTLGRKHFVCKVCSARFLSESELRNHAKRHSKPRRFSCPDCHKTYTKPSLLKLHSYNHSGKFPFRCPFCSWGFPERTKLQRHLNRHREEPTETCEICEKSFKDQASLARHTSSTHKKPDHRCHVCGRCFFERDELLAHRTLGHCSPTGNSPNQGEGPATCSIKSDSQKGQNTHPRERPKCDPGRSQEDGIPRGSDSEHDTDLGENQSKGDLSTSDNNNEGGSSSNEDDRDTDVGSLEEDTASNALKSLNEDRRFASAEKERNIVANDSAAEDLDSEDNYLTIRTTPLGCKKEIPAKTAEIPNRPEHFDLMKSQKGYFRASEHTSGNGVNLGKFTEEYFSSGVKRNFNDNSTEGAKEQKNLLSSLNEIENNVDAPNGDVIEKTQWLSKQPKIEYLSREIKTEISMSEDHVQHSKFIRQTVEKHETLRFTKRCIIDEVLRTEADTTCGDNLISKRVKMESALLGVNQPKDVRLKRLYIIIPRLRADLVADLEKSKEGKLKADSDIETSPHQVSALNNLVTCADNTTMRLPNDNQRISTQVKYGTKDQVLSSNTEEFLLPDLETDSDERRMTKLEYRVDVKEQLLPETRI